LLDKIRDFVQFFSARSGGLGSRQFRYILSSGGISSMGKFTLLWEIYGRIFWFFGIIRMEIEMIFMGGLQ